MTGSGLAESTVDAGIMSVKRFEDLIFWQKARELTRTMYLFTRNGEFRKDFGLKDQIQRFCVSVRSNIAEGLGRGGNNEFVQFLFSARGSLAEVQSQLCISGDLGYITEREIDTAYETTEEISRLINSFIKSLKGNS